MKFSKELKEQYKSLNTKTFSTTFESFPISFSHSPPLNFCKGVKKAYHPPIRDIKYKKLEVPGPGSYKSMNGFKDNCPLFGERYEELDKVIPSKYPGPGEYDITSSINRFGIYQNSKFRSSRTGLINPKERTKKSSFKYKLPELGPGFYEDSSTFDSTGFYYNAKHKSSKSRTFSKSKRF